MVYLPPRKSTGQLFGSSLQPDGRPSQWKRERLTGACPGGQLRQVLPWSHASKRSGAEAVVRLGAISNSDLPA